MRRNITLLAFYYQKSTIFPTKIIGQMHNISFNHNMLHTNIMHDLRSLNATTVPSSAYASMRLFLAYNLQAA